MIKSIYCLKAKLLLLNILSLNFFIVKLTIHLQNKCFKLGFRSKGYFSRFLTKIQLGWNELFIFELADKKYRFLFISIQFFPQNYICKKRNHNFMCFLYLKQIMLKLQSRFIFRFFSLSVICKNEPAISVKFLPPVFLHENQIFKNSFAEKCICLFQQKLQTVKNFVLLKFIDFHDFFSFKRVKSTWYIFM